MDGAVLAGVVALVYCSDGDATVKAAIQAKLQRCGARVASRIGSEVTHVVFKSTLTASRAEQDADLWDLYNKIDKQERPPVVVSPLWLEACIRDHIRAMVRITNVAACLVVSIPRRNTATLFQNQSVAAAHGSQTPPRPAPQVRDWINICHNHHSPYIYAHQASESSEKPHSFPKIEQTMNAMWATSRFPAHNRSYTTSMTSVGKLTALHPSSSGQRPRHRHCPKDTRVHVQ